MTLWKWSQTAASNSNADSTINYAENQAPSSLNDSARAAMAAVAKYRDDNSGILDTTGTSTAYTITTNQDFTSLVDGLTVVARMHTTSGASPTLAVDGLTAKAINYYTGTVVPSGGLLDGSLQKFTYDLADDCFYVQGFIFIAQEIPATTAMLFVQTSAPTGWTKSTTHDDKALRVVSGAASSGGTANFSAAFASRTPAGTVGSTTLDVTQIPAHQHLLINADNEDANGLASNNYVAKQKSSSSASDYNLQGTATLPTLGLSESVGGGSSHTHSFTGTAMDFAVKYVDCIIATKD